MNVGSKMFGSVIQNSRYRPLTPINTVIMFVPQQQVCDCSTHCMLNRLYHLYVSIGINFLYIFYK